MKLTTTIILTAPLLLTGTALAQGPSFLNPEPISGVGSFPFDTTGFTPSLLSMSCGIGVQNDGWFRWTSNATGAYSFLICDQPTFDTFIALYAGGGEIACSAGGACTPSLLVSELSPGVLQGNTEYLIQITGWDGATGSGVLDIFGPPNIVGEDCEDAVPISGEGSFPFSTVGMTPSGVNTSCGSGVENDFWFEWTPAGGAGDYRFAVCPAADYDVVVAARATDCSGPEVACADEEGCTSSFNDLEFTIPNVSAGDTYQIQITGWSGATGSGSLQIEALPPDNNSCFGAQPISGMGTFAWDTTNATTNGSPSPSCLVDGVDQIYNDVWFEWSPGIGPNAAGTYRIMTCGTTGLDTKIAAYGPVLGGCTFLGEPVACGDQECGNQTIVTVNVPTININPYLIRVGSFSANSTGAGDLIIERVQAGASVGTNYCVGASNSVSASGAVMSAASSASLGANDFTLTAAPLPSGEPGLFYFGPTQLQVAFGEGFRCVGAPFFRLPVVYSSATGTASYALDLSAPPASGNIDPGDTWNFQFWHRDPSGGSSGFNLSDGLSVGFLP